MCLDSMQEVPVMVELLASHAIEVMQSWGIPCTPTIMYFVTKFIDIGNGVWFHCRMEMGSRLCRL